MTDTQVAEKKPEPEKDKLGKVTDELMAQAGVDVQGARAAIEKLDQAFGGEVGDIPEPALDHWVDEFFDAQKFRAFFKGVGRQWEQEHAAKLSADRKWERELSPEKAAEKRAAMNVEADKARAKAAAEGVPHVPAKPYVSPGELEHRAAQEQAERDRVAAELDAKAAAEREAKIDAELKKTKQPA